MTEIKNISDGIGPNIIKTIKSEEIKQWQLKNLDNKLINNIDLNEIEDIQNITIIGFEYNLGYPDLPQGCMSISPYYYFSNKYFLELKELFKKMEEQNKIKILLKSPLKVYANLAGVGYYGKNSIIHNDIFGSTMFLYGIGIYETQNCVELNEVYSDCGSCNICVVACPTKALDGSGRLTKEKCLRNYMLEDREVPFEYRAKMGDRLLGCDICQKVCPKNIKASYTNIMPDYDEDTFYVDNYLKNKDKGLKQYLNPLSEWIGKNYARKNRVLKQCEIISENIK